MVPGWSYARLNWKSSTTANAQRILYATAAEWAANPGVYHTYNTGHYPTLTSAAIQGDILTGLTESTTYHVASESSSDNGVTWCAAVDKTFTTAAYTGAVYPIPPTPVTVGGSFPPVTHSTLLVGTSSGCTGADNATAFQNCLNIAQPGDHIVLPHGQVFPTGTTFTTPPDHDAIASSAVNISPTNTITCAACISAGWTNGTLVVLGSSYAIPQGLSKGIPYKIINVSGNTFQISYDGTNPVTLVDTGAPPVYLAKFPITHDPIVVMSDGNLPPFGVTFDPVAYASQTAIIQKTASVGVQPDYSSLITFGPLSSNWWIGPGLQFSTLPIAIPTETDPFYYSFSGFDGSGSMLESSTENYNMVWERNYFNPAPAPDRLLYSRLEVTSPNSAVMNNYFGGGNFYNLSRFIPNSVVSGNTITVQPGTYSWPGAGGKHTCTIASPQTLTITGGSGSEYIEIGPIPSCGLTAVLSTGMTATGTGFSIVNAATPAYSLDSNRRLTVLLIGSGSFSGGAVSGWVDHTGQIGAEGSFAVNITNNPGPLLIKGNTILWTNIGVFGDVHGSSTGPCCAPPFVEGDFTVTRNLFEYDPAFYQFGSTWNGGTATTHTGPWETKTGNRILFSGNRIMVSPVNVGFGYCTANGTLNASWPANFVNEQSATDMEIAYNTCLGVGAGGGAFGNYNYNPMTSTAAPTVRWRVHDNIYVPAGYAAGSVITSAMAGGVHAGAGRFWGDIESVQDLIHEHNLLYLNSGNSTQLFNFGQWYAVGGWVVRDNIFSYAGDGGNGIANSGNNAKCGGLSGINYVNCLPHATWSNNVSLATWATSNPAAYVEMTPSAISAYAAQNPTMFWTGSGLNALSDRTAQVGWNNPPTLPALYAPLAGDLNLHFNSLFKSGGQNRAMDSRDVGPDMDALADAQGKVTNAHSWGLTSTSTNITFTTPNDGFSCSVDWGTTAFWTGTGTWTRVNGTQTTRVQTVALTGLPAHAGIDWRVNCEAMQPTGFQQLP